MTENFRTAELAKTLYKQCQRLSTKGAVRNQLDRASLSIYLNLVEGDARQSKADRCRFFNIALASLRETQALLDLIDAHKELKLADQVGASLWCLIRALGSSG